MTFRVEVNYVEIDAIVTDAQGNFVRDLTRTTSRLSRKASLRTCRCCSLVDIPIERTDAPLFSPTAIQPDVRSNAKEFNGRVFVLVLDDLQTHFGRSVASGSAAQLFVERYLGANDIAPIVQTGARKDGAQEFTGNRTLLLKAIDTFAGQKLRSATLDKIDDYYMQQRDESGRRDAARFERGASAPSRRATRCRRCGRSPTTLPVSAAGARPLCSSARASTTTSTTPIQNRYASDVRDEMQAAIAAATRANVSFYGVDPRGLQRPGDEAHRDHGDSRRPDARPRLRVAQRRAAAIAGQPARRSPKRLADSPAVNRNDFREAFCRIIQDNSGYYLLGYYSNDTRRDGRFRRIQVRVKRPGLTVRARKGYTAPKGKAQPTTTLANTKTSPALREALDSPIPISGLALSVFAAPFKGTAPNASIAVTIEIDGRALSFAEQTGSSRTTSR